MQAIKKIAITTIFLMAPWVNLYSISIAEISSKEYRFSAETLRDMKTMIHNFKNGDLSQKYSALLKQFEQVAYLHYARDYEASTAKFYALKLKIMELSGSLAKSYIERTGELLKTSAIENKSLHYFLHFGRNNSFRKYFNKPFNPLIDVKPYTKDFQPKDFHFFYDAEKIERYLENGYYHLGKAKKMLADPWIPYLENKKRIKRTEVDYIIVKKLNAVRQCRIAKECGIEIYRLSNYHETGAILDKYNITSHQLTPIFDDRIPEKYKPDAIDNRKLLVEVEEGRRKKALDKN